MPKHAVTSMKQL